MTGNDDAPAGVSMQATAARVSNGVDEIGVDEIDRAPQGLVMEFAPSIVQRMHEIRRMSDATTHAELVKDALRLFDWFLLQRAAGWRLQLVRGDVVREVEVSFR
jgi:hypothetical protein